MMLRSLVAGLALCALTIGAASGKPISAPPDVPKRTIVSVADCKKAGGKVVTQNGVSTCVYPAGERRGYGIYIVGQ